VLHDIGKIHELTYGRTFGYSSEGQLLGHITIGLRMLDQKCAQFPDFPPRLKLLVEHLILSHHGKYEFGSPKLPMFPEALMLHYLDDLDSKLESMRASVASDRQGQEDWTRYNPSMERSLLKKGQFLEVTAEPRESSISSRVGEPSNWRPEGKPGSEVPSETRRPPAKPMSLFGERLQSAIKEGDEDL
jgi:3'-5' exoribonuclease